MGQSELESDGGQDSSAPLTVGQRDFESDGGQDSSAPMTAGQREFESDGGPELLGAARRGAKASLSAMADCLFCKIIAGEVPSKEVASTPATYAFFDINPAAPVHFLVVPRKHITNAAEIQSGDGDVLAEMFSTARAAAGALGIAEDGYRLVFNVGDHALNSVPHLHMHVLGGQQMGWPPGVDPIR